MAKPIGKVATAEGPATAARADGTVATLAVGDPVYQGDVLQTGAGGAVGLVFNDHTTFALGSDARMVLDKLIYDSDTGDGSSAFLVVQGIFVFVSGEIAANNPDEMVVQTPVATIGVRGTKVTGEVAGEESTIVLLAEGKGEVGSIVVSYDGGRMVMDEPNQSLAITTAEALPVVLSDEEIETSYGSVIKALPPSPGKRVSDDDGGDQATARTDGADAKNGAGELDDGEGGADKTEEELGPAAEAAGPAASVPAELAPSMVIGIAPPMITLNSPSLAKVVGLNVMVWPTSSDEIIPWFIVERDHIDSGTFYTSDTGSTVQISLRSKRMRPARVRLARIRFSGVPAVIFTLAATASMSRLAAVARTSCTSTSDFPGSTVV